MDAHAFAKGHGTGNDFVIIPDPDGELDLSPQLVTALCHRRFGVGADGVLRAVRASAHPATAGREGDTQWFMDYRNADGSVAEMCGNGVRVFVRYLVEAGLAPPGEMTVATRTGPVAATVTDQAVTVTMDLPRVYGESTARIGARELPGTAVDCGNPHLVCVLPEDLHLVGLDLSVPPRVDPAFFPAGVNVELIVPGAVATASHRRVVGMEMRVHERGVGETLSCGSGACAAAAAMLHRAGAETADVVVDLPGGRLSVRLTDRTCELTGSAVLVARGRVNLAAVQGGLWNPALNRS